MSMKFEKRDLIKVILSVPIIGTISAALLSPFVRYLKPSSGPLATLEIFKTPDKPKPVKVIKFDVNDFPEPWSFKYFMFQETNREYTSINQQIKTIPVFNFFPNEAEVAAGYNYTPNPGQKVFACPCHLSVYDPMLEDTKGRGKVVSGPAPRSPFKFNFNVNDGMLAIESLESGGIS